ncbi:Glucuronosyltransferase [Bertholletia excelsa]
MLKTAVPSKALVIRINLLFLALFLVIYAGLLLRPSLSVYHDALIRCSLRECHNKEARGITVKAALVDSGPSQLKPKRNMTKREKPNFLNAMGRGLKIGMINMEDEDVSNWTIHGQTIPIKFEQVSNLFEWKDLFPEWIDEEEEIDGPMCPEVPMPKFENYARFDLVVAKLPCRWPEEGWRRDVWRLQVHLVAANVAAKRGKREWNGRTKVVLLSKCRPMLELFRCDDMLGREGDWWFFESDPARLEQKVALPVGSCNLALPLWDKGIDQVYDVSKIQGTTTARAKREAYATVLHSTESYVCGAIALAQSLVQSGTKRDLILLLDKSISVPKREALAAAGWQIRIIKRIRNPRAEKDSYNEYNYSKFRLWQLTDYDKIIFIDSDIIVLRNLDLLFHFPQMAATGNDASIFNSGIMVIEPSKCTFHIFMRRRHDVISYNGGDQGFLNELFVWWHRLPRRVNFLKNFWSNYSGEAHLKNHLFGSDPPKLYSIHYLGLKPWLCYRDYDCNWDLEEQRVYASDVAHKRWWKLHDSMDEKLQGFCRLPEQRKIELEWDRKKAREAGSWDPHCWMNVTDPRRLA